MALGTVGPSGPTGPLTGARAAHGERPALTTAERLGGVLSYFATRYRYTWRGSIIGRFLSPLFFLLSMGLGLGTLVDSSAGGIDGVPYLQYVVPGILATQAMWVAMGECTYQVLGLIKWNMGYHAMLATPLRVRDVLGGQVGAVAGHLTVATLVFVAVSSLFGGLSSWWALLCLPVTVLVGLAFAVPILAFTATQNGDDGFNILFRWVVTPLMLFSGTFFPIDQLPVWMQPVAWVTPLWHGVEANRAFATGSIDPGWLALHLLALVGYVVVGWVVAARTWTRRLAP